MKTFRLFKPDPIKKTEQYKQKSLHYVNRIDDIRYATQTLTIDLSKKDLHDH